MRRFELLEPSSVQEACGILAAEEDARLIAGGTALLILIKQGIFIPKTLVNLKKVKGGGEISYDPNRGLRVGALATIYQVENNPVVRQRYPLLADACHVVANIRIRNMATIGGNLAHADYQSDPPAVLVALGASLELVSRSGSRELKLADFLLGSYETALAPGEMVSAVLVPPPAAGMKGVYIKFTTRSSEDRPCAGVAALVRMANGVCEEARLVVGAVSPAPVLIARAQELAEGKTLTSDLVREISHTAGEAVEPMEDLRGPADYKREVVRVLVGRALTACAEGRSDR